MAEESRDSVASGKSGNGGRRPSMKRRSTRGSFFSRARMSFYRSAGTRGASVETLRGTTGADFEANAKVQRGQPAALRFCCSGVLAGGDKEQPKKERFILIKGHFLFVFSSEDAESPKYAIDLTHMRTEVDHTLHGTTSVLLETALGDVDYKFVFDTTQDAEIAQKFERVVAEQSALGDEELVKKRLGHEKLMKKHASVRYAETVGAKKTKAQPDAPVTAAELIDASPVPMTAFY